ncbi:DUF2069 domain-containing protein [Shewanella surugensis]|uniref:DUF2069 domain-containing protein n=1 Tax=Shewanella surugensis TaxID=212020 RepID=A0ABT0LGZ1_9GAMM|nr:DUF2069 domain-containing protein [Shewanella surugensis]MCL1126963.1 DUF2069 domain-containing protein [Shewanella surugensis]
MNTNTLFTVCRAGYCLLVLLLGAQFIHQGMSGEYSLIFSILWILPLISPLKGVIKGDPYTYAWGSFILCLYMLHGLTLLYVTQDQFIFALSEVILIGALLIGFPFYARMRGRELGLGLKKQKKA